MLLALVRGADVPPGLVDWRGVHALALAEGVLGLVARTPVVRQLPPDVGGPFEGRRLGLGHLAQTALSALARLFEAFRDRGLRLLTFKGPVMAHQLYGCAGARAFSDLDLAVAPEELHAVQACLADLGYRVLLPVTGPQFRTLRRFGKEWPYVAGERELPVDLHWRFGSAAHPLPLSFDEAWQGRTEVEVGARRFAAPGDVHALVLVANHAAADHWRRLEQLVRLDRFARRDLDWDRADALAARLHTRRRLGLGFLLAERWLSTPLPPLPRSLAAARPALPWALGITERSIFAHRSAATSTFKGSALFDGRLDAFRALAAAALVPGWADWEAVRLPPALNGLYWLLRPPRLAWRAARRRLSARAARA